MLPNFTAKTWQAHLKEGHVMLGPADTTPASPYQVMGAALVTVGLSSGDISINRTVTRAQLQSSQLRHRYGSEDTEIEQTVEFTMDQFGLYNLQIHAAVAKSQISSSSILVLAGDAPQPYKCLRVITDRPFNAFSTSAKEQRQFDFFKVKTFGSGPIALSRETKAGIPIVAECYANDLDIVGEIADTNGDWEDPAWEENPA